MADRLRKIRNAERASHLAVYSSAELYRKGSWLEKPVRTVMELLPLFRQYQQLRVLDLGCGVGRNSIPIAQRFESIACTIDCVDILEYAIEKLDENAKQYAVMSSIRGIVSPIEDYQIEQDFYDLILAISALEHVDCKETFVRKLEQLKVGTRTGGIVCLVINSNVVEREQETGKELPPQFEVNLPTGEITALLGAIYEDWESIKQTIVHQCYDIPREQVMASLETDVVTFVARKL